MYKFELIKGKEKSIFLHKYFFSLFYNTSKDVKECLQIISFEIKLNENKLWFIYVHKYTFE